METKRKDETINRKKEQKNFFDKLTNGIMDSYDIKAIENRIDEIEKLHIEFSKFKGKKSVPKEAVDKLVIISSVSGYLTGRLSIIEKMGSSDNNNEVDYIG